MHKYDIAIAGTSLQAAMIAGLLAHEHKKRVCLFIDNAVQHQLSRELNLAFDIFIRPETWEMLRLGQVQVLPIITKIGGGDAIKNVNPLVVCHKQDSADAMGHLYHLFMGNDWEIERLSVYHYAPAIAAFRLRKIKVIQSKILWPALFNWLNILGVDTFSPKDLDIISHRNGSATLKTPTDLVDVQRMVLADEQAIHTLATTSDIDRLFTKSQTVCLTTEPVKELSEAMVLSPEFKFSARTCQNESLEVLAHISMEKLGALLHQNLPGEHKIRRAGRAVFPSLVMRDGAPLAGKIGRSSPWGIAGFGNTGIFFAPALARLIADKPTELEASYFDKRTGGSKRQTVDIADFSPLQRGKNV